MRPELRLAIRRLIKEPALAITAVVTLALGIGACTAMFSVVEAVLLKSMDIAQPQQLVVMWPQFGDTAGEFSYPSGADFWTPAAILLALTSDDKFPEH